MPMGQLASRAAELDSSRRVYVICASGSGRPVVTGARADAA
jgi:hypothetical protein